jgi:hypothetical protein
MLAFVFIAHVKADAVTNFTVRASSEQAPKGYFDLSMKNGADTTLKITVSSNTDKPIALSVAANYAGTTNLGGINYITNLKDKDTSMEYPFNAIVDGPKEVFLNAGETKTLEYKIKAPEKFDGAILGGFVFMEKDMDSLDITSEGLEETNTGPTFVNTVSYTIACLLKIGTTEPEPKVAIYSIVPDDTNHQNILKIRFQNPSAYYLGDLTYELEVKDPHGKTVATSKQTNFKFAPNTSFNYDIALTEPWTAGKYKLTGKVYREGEEKVWQIAQSFEYVENQPIKVVNYIPKYAKPFPWLLISLGIAGTLLAAIIALGTYILITRHLILKARRRAEEQNQKLASETTAYLNLLNSGFTIGDVPDYLAGPRPTVPDDSRNYIYRETPNVDALDPEYQRVLESEHAHRKQMRRKRAKS